jgi:hypothetical protein
MLNLLIEKDVRIWNRSSFLAMYSITSHADMDLQHSEKIVLYVALFFTCTTPEQLSLPPCCQLGNITLIVWCAFVVGSVVRCSTGSKASMNRFETT